LIIFGANILFTTVHQKTIQVLTSTKVCFCTTWGSQNTWNWHWNEQKMPKTSITLSVATWKKMMRI